MLRKPRHPHTHTQEAVQVLPVIWYMDDPRNVIPGLYWWHKFMHSSVEDFIRIALERGNGVDWYNFVDKAVEGGERLSDILRILEEPVKEVYGELSWFKLKEGITVYYANK